MNFKKILCITLMLLSIAVLAACGGNDPVKDTYYTVSFEADGGSDVNAISVKEGEAAIAPADPTKAGYTFAGWYNGNSEWDFNAVITADMTLTAKWEKVVYNVTFMDGNNTVDMDIKTYTIEDETITLPDVTKNHYNFLGWYLDPEFTESAQAIVKGSSGDLTFYAQYTVKNYGITYYLYDGINSDGNASAYNIESEFPVVFGTPTKDGYKFLGWYKDANFTEEFNSIPELMGDVVVYASWEKLPDEPVDPDIPDVPPVEPNVEYTIKYLEGNAILVLGPDKYLSGSECELPVPTKEHYDFLGWYTTSTFDEGTKLNKITETTHGNLELYARFEAKVYTITYYVEGGVNNEANILTYTIEDQNFKLQSPTKEGYKFLGWYLDPNYKVHIATLKGKTGDLVLYAKWEQESEGGILTPEQPL